MKPYSQTVNKHTHTRTHTHTYVCMHSRLRAWALRLQLLLIMCWNCVCVSCFQGMQGESGPKGDPGPYGLKGAKVRNEKEIKRALLLISNGVLAVWNETLCVCFREILEETANQGGLETTAHREIRWISAKRKNERRQKTDVHGVYHTKQEIWNMCKCLCCDRVNEALPETTATKESVVTM